MIKFNFLHIKDSIYLLIVKPWVEGTYPHKWNKAYCH